MSWLGFKKLLYRWSVKRGKLYSGWSKHIQKLDKQYIGTRPNWGDLTPKVAQAIMNKIQWREDDWKRLGDAFRHPDVGDHLFNCIIRGHGDNPDDLANMPRSKIPGRIMHYNKGHGQPPNEPFDCDEFSLWCATRLQARYDVRILNVVWSTGKKLQDISGHNLCLIKMENEHGVRRYYHMGNWGTYGGFRTVNEAVADVVRKAGSNRLIGWHMYNPRELYRKK